MREIKFKGWNGKRITREYTLKEMLVEQLENNGLKEIWMQYTGLKDKNGKEIYEGDIVRNENDKKPNQKIIFARGMFCLDDEDSPLWKYNPKNFWEIVGNVYENPELLNPHTT